MTSSKLLHVMIVRRVRNGRCGENVPSHGSKGARVGAVKEEFSVRFIDFTCVWVGGLMLNPVDPWAVL